MARSGRPASESYQSTCCSVGQTLSLSGKAMILEDEDDQSPIFSLSKSSVDVVMATGSPHKRDPVWTRLDLKRSSSTNTHSDQNQGSLVQQLHPHKWRHNSHHFFPTTQNEELMSPPSLSERWISNTHRWSGCSSSTHSRSSTPDTVVWKGTSSSQDVPSTSTPDSPMSKITSPPTIPSPFISPFHTPSLPSEDNITSSSPSTLSAHHAPESCHHPWPTSPREEGSEGKLIFQFPSPVPSHFSLADAEGGLDPGCLVNDIIKELSSPGDNQVSEGEGAKSPLQMFCNSKPNSFAEEENTNIGSSGCHLGLTLQPEQRCLVDPGWRSPLVSSLSDSQLGPCVRCKLTPWGGALKTYKLFREKATMTSQMETADAAVQTASPLGSCCDLQRDMSTGSHSFLGSPPGSRLNLKLPVGSHSNLVSASSSMFPVSSGEEEEKKREDPEWDVASGSSHNLERTRTYLNLQQEETDERGRRGSMKQVQWGEDGLTWEIHGASLDPKELSSAIQKHLDLKNSPKPLRCSSKKKKAPLPPLISNMVTTMEPGMSQPAMSIKCLVEGESQDMLAEEGKEVIRETGNKKPETEEADRRRSKGDHEISKEIEEDEVQEQEVISNLKLPSHKSEHGKKKTKIISLRRPGWCGGSRKIDD
ncbi:uncharacterized protein [Nothobranchius furzeri]|uniref:LOC107387712-like protein n=1 Tax=Nothobranchius furzeri TaxID=105023 RepID=A0A9D2XLS1_NOTFU|nr:putative LOC107387712-like protein [Nothobranchius furzeri]